MEHIKKFNDFLNEAGIAQWRKEREDFKKKVESEQIQKVQLENVIWQYRIHSPEISGKCWNSTEENIFSWHSSWLGQGLSNLLGSKIKKSWEGSGTLLGKDFFDILGPVELIDADENLILPEDEIDVEEGSDS